jgi:nucleoside-diphosphate-sugar epimerase
MKKICITGANGFIGKSICQSLINTNYRVRAFTRSYTGIIEARNIEYIKINSDFNKVNWKDLLNGYDCVIHCAGKVPSLKKKNFFNNYKSINIDGTRYLAEQSSKAKIKRFIFLSSINVLGSNTNKRKPFVYSDKPKPDSDYGFSKFLAEKKLKKISKETGLDITIIRPPIVYGPNAPGNFKRLIKIVNTGIPLPFGKINNKRSFIGISNLIEVIKKCIKNPKAAGKTFLVSDGEDLSTVELINYINSINRKSSRLFPFPKLLLSLFAKIINKNEEMSRLLGSLQVDITYTIKVLNWRPSTSVKDEIKKMLKYYD